MANHPLLQSASHVALDSFTVDRLLKLGAKNVVPSLDCLVIGPCRRDPREHEQVRRAFWNKPETEKADLPYPAEVPIELPVIVWASASVPQRVKLWRACQWLRAAGFPAAQVFVLDFPMATPRRPPQGPPPPFNCHSSVGDHSDEALVRRLAETGPVSRERYAQAASLWDLYAGDDPSPFVERCRLGLDGFPELGPLWTLLSSFFPRRAADAGLHLSRFDALLLQILSGEWQSPVQVFAHESVVGEELRRVLECTGDLFVERRLAQWSGHGAPAVVERDDRPNPGRPMASAAYRITERGARLRERGLDNLLEAPPLPVAGTEAYAAHSPWVLVEDGHLVTVTRSV